MSRLGHSLQRYFLSRRRRHTGWPRDWSSDVCSSDLPPDIEEFVATKAREEGKIRVLREAGFDVDLGGADITSVQYQNANNSVRVTDELMRAVEAGGGFALGARRDHAGGGAGAALGPVDPRAPPPRAGGAA